MAENLPATGDGARPHLRSVVTTILFVLISVMIVRDMLVRRWSGSPPSPPDTTHQSR